MDSVEYELLKSYIKKNKYRDPYLAVELRSLDATQIRLSGNKINEKHFDGIIVKDMPARLLTKDEYLAQRRATTAKQMTKEQFYKLNTNIEQQPDNKSKNKKTKG
ncbi:hypothetical protein [Aeromonas hydrophila]|uniref:Uncharacterized protein n=1 Tax=Aeromonas hydrophila TaxID=644 RepID=A0AAX3PDR6_AERHY|nr:hypothetical protein [Aeromonas hydrophila]MDM5119980.1 hypothetical protein [Aeromonas hydrophila]WEE28318.1 hypothetical protein PY771_08370 [Aeromonas hydrophila]